MEPDRTKQMMRRTGGLLLMFASLGGLAMAQFPLNPIAGSNANSVSMREDVNRGRGEIPTIDQEVQQKQLKKLRELHQKEVFDDTARLLRLATELKTQVDKANKPTADEMKDVDEIGKLAKRVSERIKME